MINAKSDIHRNESRVAGFRDALQRLREYAIAGHLQLRGSRCSGEHFSKDVVVASLRERIDNHRVCYASPDASQYPWNNSSKPCSLGIEKYRCRRPPGLSRSNVRWDFTSCFSSRSMPDRIDKKFPLSESWNFSFLCLLLTQGCVLAIAHGEMVLPD
jgi:hypothetical protein